MLSQQLPGGAGNGNGSRPAETFSPQRGNFSEFAAGLGAAGTDSPSALRHRLSSLEECNALLQHRVGQLESAVAVLARLVEHPLVQEAIEGTDAAAGQAANGAQGDPENGGDATEGEEGDSPRGQKRKDGEGSAPKKKWYELIALIKEMKPNNGYPIRSLIIAAIESAKADPLYANSNIPERLERSMDNYCRKSAGPTKRAALQVLDSVWQFVQQPIENMNKKPKNT